MAIVQTRLTRRQCDVNRISGAHDCPASCANSDLKRLSRRCFFLSLVKWELLRNKELPAGLCITKPETFGFQAKCLRNVRVRQLRPTACRQIHNPYVGDNIHRADRCDCLSENSGHRAQIIITYTLPTASLIQHPL